MDSLSLSIPDQHNYTDPTVERDVDRLHNWLTNLPLMDVVETVRLVHGALDALNEQKLPFEKRFQYLEVYRATAQRLFVTVDPLHLRQLALTKLQRQEAIDGVEQLFLSIAGGYKLIVVELYQAAGDGVQKPLFGQAINRALEQLSYCLLDSYRFYRAVQPRLIAESHQLYRLARHHGLLSCCLDKGDGHSPAASIAMLYHTSMLLSLTDPFRLAEGEVSLLFEVLMQHAVMCRIIPGNSWIGNGDGLFLVELLSDKLPVPCSSLDSPVNTRDPYLLDATAALAAVRERLAKTPARVRMQSPEAMVLRRLLPEEAKGVDKRREQRRSDGRWVSLLLGLSDIHQYLAFAANKGPGRQAGDSAAQSGELTACRVVDSSEKGLKLWWDGSGAVDARVGDLLGIMEEQGVRQSLKLAMIRSIRVYHEGGMEAGVQLMEGGLGPVTCHLTDQPDKVGVRALFMHADDSEQFTATLVAGKGLYKEGRRVTIDVGGREVKARAGRRVLDSPVFDRFEFSAE
jgi:cyclic-di-GMP-binding protein